MGIEVQKVLDSSILQGFLTLGFGVLFLKRRNQRRADIPYRQVPNGHTKAGGGKNAACENRALHEEKHSRHGMGPLMGKASTSHLSQWRILAMIKVSLTSPPDELLLHPKRPHRERDWNGLLQVEELRMNTMSFMAMRGVGEGSGQIFPLNKRDQNH